MLNGLQVQINGDVQQWTFGSDYKWQRQTEVYICKNIGAKVTSICLNVAQNSLYWCECVQKEDGDCYTLYKRAVKEGNIVLSVISRVFLLLTL